MDSDKLHNSSAFSSMAEHISPDVLALVLSPGLHSRNDSQGSHYHGVSPSAAESITATARIVFFF